MVLMAVLFLLRYQFKGSIMINIVLVEDDPDDVYFFRSTLTKLNLAVDLVVLKNGLEFVDFMHKNNNEKSLILLDLNMPKMGGIAALEAIKDDVNVNQCIIVAFTTSDNQDDINKAYTLGIKSYIKKPDTQQQARDLLLSLITYWFQFNQLPKLEQY